MDTRFTLGRTTVLYELRTYVIAPGRMRAILDRFADITVHYFHKHGIRPLLYLEPVIGTSNEMVYLVAWNSLAEREQRWNAFMNDPEWIAARAATEADGPIVLSYRAEIFAEVPRIIENLKAIAEKESA